MKYFKNKYVSYYNEFSEDTGITSNASIVLENIQLVSNQFDNVVSFVNSSNWSGEAKQYIISSSLPILKERINILENNISNSLLPSTKTAIDELLVNLKIMKEKDEMLDTKEIELNNAIEIKKTSKRNYDNASNYVTKNNEKVYTGDKDKAQEVYDTACSTVKRLQNEIVNLNDLLLETKKNCDNNITTIEVLNDVIELFVGTDKRSNRISDIEGLEEWQSTFFEKDGIFYQIPIRINNKGSTTLIEPNYIICIDSNKLKNTLGEYADLEYKNGISYYEYFTNYLKERVKNPSSKELYDFTVNKHDRDKRNAITLVINQILDDSYVYNGASTIQDYATISATVVATNPIAKFGYGVNNNFESIGVDSALNNGGKFDCITFVGWCYYQGLSKVADNNGQELVANYKSWTPYNLMTTYSEKIVDINENPNFSIEDIDVGSILTKPTGDTNYHIAIIIGEGINSNGESTFVCAQASSGKGGVIISEYSKNNLYNEWAGKSREFEKELSGIATSTTVINKLTSN